MIKKMLLIKRVQKIFKQNKMNAYVIVIIKNNIQREFFKENQAVKHLLTEINCLLSILRPIIDFKIQN